MKNEQLADGIITPSDATSEDFSQLLLGEVEKSPGGPRHARYKFNLDEWMDSPTGVISIVLFLLIVVKAFDSF